MKVKQWITTGVLVSVMVGHWLGVGLPVQAQATDPTDASNTTLTHRVFLPTIATSTEMNAEQDVTVKQPINADAVVINTDGVMVTQDLIPSDQITVSLDTEINRESGDGGSVESVQSASIPCYSPWVCLYGDKNFGSNRKPQWSDPGTFVNLKNIGFDNQMSSWRNLSPYYAVWYYNANKGGASRCMPPHTSVSYVGWWDNDEASSLWILPRGWYCY